MNNKIIIGLVVIALLIGGFYVLSQRNTATSPTIESQENSISEENMMESQEKSAADTVSLFMDAFITSAPANNDGEVVDEAISVLSEGAKMEMGEEPTTGDLAAFIGVQDIPDEGYEIGDITYSDNPATGAEDGMAVVEVSLRYSGGDTQREFRLSKTDEKWQIDSISQQ